jgi:hypothetical protein
MRPSFALWNQRISDLLEPLCPKGFSSHRTRENSSHVGIDNRHVIFKCEGKNSSSAIGADTWKG